jgi:hypothetical protein
MCVYTLLNKSIIISNCIASNDRQFSDANIQSVITKAVKV